MTTPYHTVVLALLRQAMDADSDLLTPEGAQALGQWLVGECLAPSGSAEPTLAEVLEQLSTILSRREMHAVEEFLTETLPLQLENPNGLYELHEAAEASLFDVGDILGEDRDPSLCTVDRSSAAGLVMRALIIEFESLDFLDACELLDATKAWLAMPGKLGIFEPPTAREPPVGGVSAAEAPAVRTPGELAAVVARGAEDARLGQRGRHVTDAAMDRALAVLAAEATGSGEAAAADARADWARYALALEARDVQAAEAHLHRFYDRAGAGSDWPDLRGELAVGKAPARQGRSQVALLALATMHASLGNNREACQSLHECFRMAQQCSDHFTLAHALLLLGTLASRQPRVLSWIGAASREPEAQTRGPAEAAARLLEQSARRGAELCMPHLEAHATVQHARVMVASGLWAKSQCTVHATQLTLRTQLIARKCAGAVGATVPMLYGQAHSDVFHAGPDPGAASPARAHLRALDARGMARVTEATVATAQGAGALPRAALEAVLLTDWQTASAETKAQGAASVAWALLREEGPGAALACVEAAIAAVDPQPLPHLTLARLGILHERALRRGAVGESRQLLEEAADVVRAYPGGLLQEYELSLLVRQARTSMAGECFAEAAEACRDAYAKAVRLGITALGLEALVTLAIVQVRGARDPLHGMATAAAALSVCEDFGQDRLAARAKGVLADAWAAFDVSLAPAGVDLALSALPVALSVGDAVLAAELRAAATRCALAAARGGRMDRGDGVEAGPSMPRRASLKTGASGPAEAGMSEGDARELLQRALRWASMACDDWESAECVGDAADAARLAALVADRLGDMVQREALAARWEGLTCCVGRVG